ncbi:hypothetical protein VTN31DRAFT_246 [Thermomyces dupontii]|uniref:uncharacterized protein n=1 Tax=Talaromyces thermophilus TaxID=28565 RepID=UPI003742DE07
MSKRNDQDDEYFVPSADQRVFGAGIKRKRVAFVRPSSDATLTTTATSSNESEEASSPGSRVADQYLAIVMGKKKKKDEGADHPQDGTVTPASTEPNKAAESSPDSKSSTGEGIRICEVCKVPLPSEEESTSATEEEDDDSTSSTGKSRGRARRATPHEASLVHQICLEHVHPPSHLDRTRHGMRYLTSYGWDPDSRRGLGASGEGILYPIKAKPKHDTIGLGVDPEEIAAMEVRRKQREEERAKQRQKLNAKQARQSYAADRKKAERLRELFYRNDDIEKYLGGGSHDFLR